MTQLTPQILVEKGFKYSAPGISGCDQWHGMGFWRNENMDVTLRGNVSTARGGTLYFWPYSRIIIESVEQLDMLIELIR